MHSQTKLFQNLRNAILIGILIGCHSQSSSKLFATDLLLIPVHNWQEFQTAVKILENQKSEDSPKFTQRHAGLYAVSDSSAVLVGGTRLESNVNRNPIYLRLQVFLC